MKPESFAPPACVGPSPNRGRPRVVAIIPAYNESGKIGSVVRKVRAVPGVVDATVVVSDASRDGTEAEARAAGATVLVHPRNMGVGAAIRTGMQWARDAGYDVGVVLSGDDQHEPSELPRVLEPILGGTADFVQGSRYMSGGRTENQGLFRKWTTRLYPWMFLLATGHRCSDVTNGFRAFRVGMLLGDARIDLDQPWLNRYELEIYMLYKVYTSRAYRRVEVPITIRYHSREVGSTKMIPLVDWWRMLRPLVYLRLGLRK